MVTNSKFLDRKVLKEKYLGCFAARATSAKTLPEVIRNLLHGGVVRATLFRWAVAAGYSQATVRSLLSRAFCSLGLRLRKAGAGRKPSAEALELLAHSCERYGNRALRVLRAGKTSHPAQRFTGERLAGAATRPMAAPQLKGFALIEGPQLHSTRRNSCQPKAQPRRSMQPFFAIPHLKPRK
jgi:hypothetical protein